MSAVILRAAEENVKQPTPDKWIFQVPGTHELRVDLSSVPPCMEKACKEVLSVVDLGDEALVKEFARTKVPSGAEVPPFGSWVCAEQHDRYMIPYLIRTPPLLALILAHNRVAVKIPDHVAVTDAHVMYRTYLSAIEFRSRSGDSDDLRGRVEAAMRCYENYAGAAEDWMAGILPKLPNFKDIVALTPKTLDDNEVPNFARFYKKESLDAFVRSHIGLMNALLCAAEIAIIRALGVRPSAAKAAKLINTEPDALLEIGGSAAHSHYADMLRAQEVTFRSQLRVETKSLLSAMSFAHIESTPFVAAQVISAEFIFLNYGLMCMALMR